MTQSDDRFPELRRGLQSPEGHQPLAVLTGAADADAQDARQLLLLASEFAGRGDFERAQAIYAGLVLAGAEHALASFHHP